MKNYLQAGVLATLLLPGTAFGQAISAYQIEPQGANALEVSALFDQDGIGPVLQDNSTVTLFVPEERITGNPENAPNGGAWLVTTVAPLSETCGILVGDLANYSIVQVSLPQSNQFFSPANLGSVYAGVAELLFTLPLTGEAGRPVYGFQPAGGDDLSDCARVYGADNTATIDSDGPSNPPFGTGAPVGYSNLPIFGAEANLPVDLLTFTAEAAVEAKALLRWTATREVALSGYAVEHSGDGAGWERLGFLAATGNGADGVFTYAFTHGAPVAGVNYYRLKLEDQDGSFSYSPVESITFGAPVAATLSVYPNPARQEVKLDLYVPDGAAELRITDPTGRLLWAATVPGGESSRLLSLPDTGLPGGVYQVTLGSSTSAVTERLVVVD